MTRKEFMLAVRKALKNLPEDFKSKLQNVAVVIENEPDMELVKELKLGSKGRLLGLYQGVPLKDRTHYYGMVLPDKITLYKQNIENECAQSGKDISDEIKHVVLHELAHHFGITDGRLTDLGVY